MSTTQESAVERRFGEHHVDDGAPRLERWLVVTLLAFVPGALIFVLPHAILERSLVYICASMAVIFFIGFGMYLKRPRD